LCDWGRWTQKKIVMDSKHHLHINEVHLIAFECHWTDHAVILSLLDLSLFSLSLLTIYEWRGYHWQNDATILFLVHLITQWFFPCFWSCFAWASTADRGRHYGLQKKHGFLLLFWAINSGFVTSPWLAFCFCTSSLSRQRRLLFPSFLFPLVLSIRCLVEKVLFLSIKWKHAKNRGSPPKTK
jgi:hypothetical protein